MKLIPAVGIAVGFFPEYVSGGSAATVAKVVAKVVRGVPRPGTHILQLVTDAHGHRGVIANAAKIDGVKNQNMSYHLIQIFEGEPFHIVHMTTFGNDKITVLSWQSLQLGQR